MFQSTHPHGVRLSRQKNHVAILWFQSTHPHGVRRKRLLGLLKFRCFNPRTHMGCDVRDFWACLSSDVSIHAPTWGATDKQVKGFSPALFQSTHPHGVRLCVPTQIKLLSVFQSTHPHGVRLITTLTITGRDKFQSTHPHGVRRSIPT